MDNQSYDQFKTLLKAQHHDDLRAMLASSHYKLNELQMVVAALSDELAARNPMDRTAQHTH